MVGAADEGDGGDGGGGEAGTTEAEATVAGVERARPVFWRRVDSVGVGSPTTTEPEKGTAAVSCLGRRSRSGR